MAIDSTAKDVQESSTTTKNEEQDIFARPHSYWPETVLAVWEKGKPGPRKHTRRDWRNGHVLGPWEPGQSRDGIWDIGHIRAWKDVVEDLKKVKGITREQVIKEFNNLDNLGVEDPLLNRQLGVNSILVSSPQLQEVVAGGVETTSGLPSREYSVDALAAREHEGVQTMADETTTVEAKKPDPKRVIVWDTETTGLSPAKGDRIVEIGAVELIDGKPTGKTFHVYLNPERRVPKQASDVHGLDDNFLKDKPKFREVVDEFLEFIGDAPMVAHNAPFDMRFINAELEALGKEPISDERKIDSVRVAKALLPGLPKYNLDTVAEVLKVDTSGRDEHHGGLVDTQILVDVFVKLMEIAAQQDMSVFDVPQSKPASKSKGDFVLGGDYGQTSGEPFFADEFAEAMALEEQFNADRARQRAEAQERSFVARLRAEQEASPAVGRG